jgi:hypothetical protein
MKTGKSLLERHSFPLFLPLCLQKALGEEAQKRGMDAQTLAQRILAAVILDGLYDAVLDDEEGQA